MTSIWEAFGHQNLEKYFQEGPPKKPSKNNAKQMPNYPNMIPKKIDFFQFRRPFFRTGPPWGGQLPPDAPQGASQGRKLPPGASWGSWWPPGGLPALLGGS